MMWGMLVSRPNAFSGKKTDDRANNPPCLRSCVTDVSEGACLIHLCVFLSNLVVLLFSVPQNSKVIFSKAFHIRLPISSRCPDNIPDAVINVYGRFVSSKLRGIYNILLYTNAEEFMNDLKKKKKLMRWQVFCPWMLFHSTFMSHHETEGFRRYRPI